LIENGAYAPEYFWIGLKLAMKEFSEFANPAGKFVCALRNLAQIAISPKLPKRKLKRRSY
jgi:hypothetical protein